MDVSKTAKSERFQCTSHILKQQQQETYENIRETPENLKRRDHSEEQGVDRKLILRVLQQ